MANKKNTLKPGEPHNHMRKPMDDPARLRWNRNRGFDPYAVERTQRRRRIDDRNRRKLGL